MLWTTLTTFINITLWHDPRLVVRFQKCTLNITYILTGSYKRHQTSSMPTLIPENLKHISSTCPCSNGDTVVDKCTVRSRGRRHFERIYAIMFLYRVTICKRQRFSFQRQVNCEQNAIYRDGLEYSLWTQSGVLSCLRGSVQIKAAQAGNRWRSDDTVVLKRKKYRYKRTTY